MDSMAGAQGHGFMTVTAQEAPSTLYDVSIVYDGVEDTPFKYTGTWDAGERRLTLRSLTEADIVGDMVLNVSKDETGTVVFETQLGGDTAILSYQATLSGKKLEEDAPAP